MSEAAPAQVSAAQPGRWRAVAAVLADAFHDDPVMSWLIPDARRRPAALRSFFGFEARGTASRPSRS